MNGLAHRAVERTKKRTFKEVINRHSALMKRRTGGKGSLVDDKSPVKDIEKTARKMVLNARALGVFSHVKWPGISQNV